MKLKIKLILAFFSIVLILNQNFISAKNVPAKQKRNLTTQDSKPQFMPGQIRVKFKPQISTNTILETGSSSIGISSFDNKLINNDIQLIKKSFKHKPIKSRFDNSGISRIFTLHFSKDKDVLKVAKEFSKSSIIEYAEPIPIYYIDIEPNDPLYNQQNHLPQIQAPQAWDVETGDSSVIIAIIDGGTDWEHPDLIDNIWSNQAEINGVVGIDDDGNGFVDDFHGWDFANEDNNPTNQPIDLYAYFHGTVTAGLAAAKGNNNLHIAGVAWNCSIMPLKHGKDDVENAIFNWADGMVYAADNGADIINASFGGFYAPSQADQDVINYAYERGVLIIASAGNTLTSAMHLPSGYDHVLSVTWVDQNDGLAWAGTYGISVDVAAPGVELLSLSPENSTVNMSGSSSATPVVAGLAGLIKSQYPEWSPLQIARQITLTTDNIDDKNPRYAGQMGSGRINAFKAVSETNLTEIAPRLKANAVSISDSVNGDNDSILERGETIEVTLNNFRNYSLSPGENVNISLTTNDSDITIINGEYELGYIAPDTSISEQNVFSFYVNDNAKGKTSEIIFNWQADGGYSGADTFTVIVGKLPVLVVDDDLGMFPTEKLCTNILDQWNVNYAIWDRFSRGPLSKSQIENFSIIIWLCEWEFPTLDSLDQIALTHFLDNGGNLFVSGQDIGWDLADPTGVGNNQYSESSLQFYQNYLHANFLADTSPISDVVGIPFDIIGSDLEFSVYQPGLPIDYQYPDEIEPAEGASGSFEYLGGENHKFGIKYKGNHKVVYFGSGFEAIDAFEEMTLDDVSPVRATVLNRIIDWLNLIEFTPVSDEEDLAVPRTVNVNIKNDSEVAQMELYWKKESDSTFTKIVMTNNGNGEYSAEIPGPNEITNIHYYFEMVSTYFKWKNPINAPKKYYSYYTGPDTVAPTFSHVELPAIFNANLGRDVVVSIHDNNGIDSANVFVHCFSKTNSDSSTLFKTETPLQFGGAIQPGFAYGDTVHYYFSAYDEANNPNRGYSEIYSFVVGLEDFESGLNNWAVNTGWDVDILYAHSGKYSISDSPGQSPYPSNRDATITTNFSIDLSHCTHAALSFWTKYYLEMNSDYGYVEISNDGGSTWHQLGSAFNGFKVVYYQETLSLSDYCGTGNTDIKIRFRMLSDGTQNAPVPGWFIDDIQIVEGKDITQVTNKNQTTVPEKFALYQNYPNPFNPSTTIQFDLPETGETTLKIFNIRGELVRTLVDGKLNAGVYRIDWNGNDNQNMSLASGVYFYRLFTQNVSSVKKLLYLK